MRQRLQKFLPIVLFALIVQILAPIGATWMAAAAAADPLGVVPICHGGQTAPPAQDDAPLGGHRDGLSACSVCCAALIAPSLETPKAEVTAIPYRIAARVIWFDEPSIFAPDRTGSNAQARGPPSVS